jgi:ribosome biogenesis GTPase
VLDTYGWDARVAALAADVASDAVVGRVVRIDRGVYSVATELGVRATSVSGALKDARDPVARPTIGDWVVLDAAAEVVETVLPRWSVFLRGDLDRLQAQAVAADVDVVFVVHTATLEPNLRRLERELVLAHQSGARPVVVLSKVDLCPDPAAAGALVAPCAPGVDVVLTSARTGDGVDAIGAYGHGGRTLACIGASGVGKSTLVNALLGAEVQATGAIRDFDGKGRHTTSARSLHPLPGGGVLIDTPGLRSVGMWRSDEGLAAAFADIEALAQDCRFSDCTHDHEPGCAVLAAVSAGALDAERVANLRTLQGELDRLDDEAEARRRVVKQQERARRRVPPTIV